MDGSKNAEDQVQVVADDQNVRDEGKTERVVEVDHIRVLGLNQEDEEFYLSYSPEARKKLIHKIDMRLCPMLACLYLISHLDRSNIGNANIEGLASDINLTGVQYNVALSILFATYIPFEIPSNLILKKFNKPSYYIAIIVSCWGLVMTFTGFVQNYAGLVVCRLLLGLFEAGFFPGAVYLCTQWYMPRDLATRLSYMYLMSALASAFSGLLAAGIAEMDGVGGFEGWRWIFILEGLATVLIGVACVFLLIDTPRLSKWLSKEEVRYLETEYFIKNGGDFGVMQHKNSLRVVGSVLADWKLWVMAFLLFVNTTAGYGVKFTMPAIIKGMGFQNRNAQLLTAPPYIAGAISTVVSSKISDRFFRRMPFIVIPWTLFAIGFGIILSFGDHSSDHVGPAYFSVFLICIGLFPVNPAITSWTANNITPSSKRAVGLAFFCSVGNLGGIVASFIYLKNEAPGYTTGYSTSIGVLGLGILTSIILELFYTRSNRKRDAAYEEGIRAKYSEQELSDMGDKSPIFRYTL